MLKASEFSYFYQFSLSESSMMTKKNDIGKSYVHSSIDLSGKHRIKTLFWHFAC